MPIERRQGQDDYRGPERRHAKLSVEVQLLELAKTVEGIDDRLKSGVARMDNMQAELKTNSAITNDVKEILDASRSGLKALGALGVVAAWVTKIGIAVGVLWGLYVAFKNGKPP